MVEAKQVEEYINALNALESLANSIRDGWADDRAIVAVTNQWHNPPLSRHNLAFMAEAVLERLRKVDSSDLSDREIDALADVPARIEEFKRHALPHMYNNNSVHAFNSYQGLLYWIESIGFSHFSPRLGWEDVSDKSMLPYDLRKRLKSLNTQIGNLEESYSDFEEKAKTIERAHDAAASLPDDIEELDNAREDLKNAMADLDSRLEKLKEKDEKAQTHLDNLKDKERTATETMQGLDSAYSAATTIGLGASFSEREKSMKNTMWVWVTILILSLAAGAILSIWRINELGDLIDKKNVDGTAIWLSVVLGILSIGGPIWLAWIATRQIGQRFRIAEDYAFKAAIAKAYEGYKREGANVDPKFSSRLFETALNRLDEAPLRYISDEEPGSPWDRKRKLRHRVLPEDRSKNKEGSED